MPPNIAVRDIRLFERPVRFMKPFRFGAVIIDAASQVFVRVEIEVEGKGTSVGASAAPTSDRKPPANNQGGR